MSEPRPGAPGLRVQLQWAVPTTETELSARVRGEPRSRRTALELSVRSPGLGEFLGRGRHLSGRQTAEARPTDRRVRYRSSSSCARSTSWRAQRTALLAAEAGMRVAP